MCIGVLSDGEGVARGVVFAGSAAFSPRMYRLCEVYVGSGVGWWRAIGKDWGVMSDQKSDWGCCLVAWWSFSLAVPLRLAVALRFSR